MATEKCIYSDLPIPPGEYLVEVLESKGMSQAELARRIGRPIQAINEIVKGAKAITPATALQFERALSVPAQIWTGLESRYRLIKARLEEKRQLEKESAYLEANPYSQLAELNCVKKDADKEQKVRELHRFYGVSSLANLPRIRAYGESFRWGGIRDAANFALAAWIRCAELRALEVPVETFDKRKLRRSLRDIRALCGKEPGAIGGAAVAELRKILARCGVALILLPHFPKTRVRAVTFWTKPDRAVLVFGVEERRPDLDCSCLFHGIGHLVLHGKKTFIDGGKVPRSSAQEGKEKEADEFARYALRGASWPSASVRGAGLGQLTKRERS